MITFLLPKDEMNSPPIKAPIATPMILAALMMALLRWMSIMCASLNMSYPGRIIKRRSSYATVEPLRAKPRFIELNPQIIVII